MIDLLLSFFMVFVFAGTGLTIFRRPLSGDLPNLDKFIFSFGLGFGIFGTVIFIAGILGMIGFYCLMALLLIGTILSLSNIKFYKAIFTSSEKIIGEYLKMTTFFKFVAWVVLIYFLFNTLISMAPVTELDAKVAHFALPKLYLKAGKIYWMEGYLYSHYPQLSVMINLFFMGLRSDIAGALFNSYLGLITAILILCVARAMFDNKVAFLAFSLFACSPLMAWEATGSYLELSLTFFSFLSFYCIFLYFKKHSKWLLVASAVFMGFGFSIKYFAVNYFILVSIYFTYKSLRNKKQWVILLKHYAVWVMLVAVAGSPWYLYNLVMTGNPVFPFLYSVFGGQGWSDSMSDSMLRGHGGLGVSRSLLSFLLLPITLTFKGHLFTEGRLIGPLILIFAPFSLLCKKYLDKTLILAFLSLIYLLLWFFESQQTRFLLPMMPLLIVLTAIGFTNLLGTTAISLRKISMLAVAFFIVFSLNFSGIKIVRTLPVLLGIETKEEFLTRVDWEYPCLEWMNKNLDYEDKVLFNGWAPYYLDIPYVVGHGTVNGLIDYSTFRNYVEFYDLMRSLNITHVYVCNRYLKMGRTRLWEDLIDNKLTKLYDCGKFVELYNPATGKFELSGEIQTVYKINF